MEEISPLRMRVYHKSGEISTGYERRPTNWDCSRRARGGHGADSVRPEDNRVALRQVMLTIWRGAQGVGESNISRVMFELWYTPPDTRAICPCGFAGAPPELCLKAVHLGDLHPPAPAPILRDDSE